MAALRLYETSPFAEGRFQVIIRKEDKWVNLSKLIKQLKGSQYSWAHFMDNGKNKETIAELIEEHGKYRYNYYTDFDLFINKLYRSSSA